MFEKASRLKLRFEYKGLLSAEDLWDLSLRDLDNIYKVLNRQTRAQAEESLLERSTEDEVLTLKIDLVKHVFGVKVAEKEARENAAVKRERKEKLLSVLAEKQDKALYDLSPEELQNLIAELE